MTENSAASTATTTDRTPTSSEIQNVLPLLSENKGSLSLTLTVDKSVSKVASWVFTIVIGLATMVGAGIVLAIWMIIAYRESRMEVALQREDIRVMQIALGRAGISTDEHETEKGK